MQTYCNLTNTEANLASLRPVPNVWVNALGIAFIDKITPNATIGYIC